MRASFPFRSLSVSIALSLTLTTPSAAASFAPPAPSPPNTLTLIDQAVAEAAARFNLPTSWIRAVMQVESAGNPRAVSRAGAIGLMQVMPVTFADLRDALGLGADPFSVRDNVLAGAAYLRAMYDRYGAPGFLAAYNGGPERWEAFRAGAKPLPAETVAYLARLAPRLGFAIDGRAVAGSPTIATSPDRSQIFVRVAQAPPTSLSAFSRPVIGATMSENADRPVPIPTLFAARSTPNDPHSDSALARSNSDSASPITASANAAITPHQNPLFVDATRWPNAN